MMPSPGELTKCSDTNELIQTPPDEPPTEHQLNRAFAMIFASIFAVLLALLCRLPTFIMLRDGPSATSWASQQIPYLSRSMGDLAFTLNVAIFPLAVAAIVFSLVGIFRLLVTSD